MGRSTGRDRHKQALNSSGHTLLVPKRKGSRREHTVNSGSLWRQVFSGMRWCDNCHGYSSKNRAWSLYGTDVYTVYGVIYSHLLPNVRDTFEGGRYSLSGIVRNTGMQ